jgi:hypothetical protein
MLQKKCIIFIILFNREYLHGFRYLKMNLKDKVISLIKKNINVMEDSPQK